MDKLRLEDVKQGKETTGCCYIWFFLKIFIFKCFKYLFWKYKAMKKKLKRFDQYY